jgi:hypothetical protein
MILTVLMWAASAACIAAYWANAHKKPWCFLMWAGANVVLAYGSVVRGVYSTAALMTVYFFMSCYGYWAWTSQLEDKR